MSNRVTGKGPSRCKIAFVGEKPGRVEAQRGIPFCGPTSQDFIKRHLPELGFKGRSEVYLTNLYREFKPDDDYTTDDYIHDGAELHLELERVKPETIVTIGRESTRFMLGDVDLDEVHGIPWWHPNDAYRDEDGRLTIVANARVIFPTYHVAAMSPEMQSQVVYDFAELKRYLDLETEPRLLYDDPYEGKEFYVEIIDSNQIAQVLDPSKPIYIDSEGSAEKPWSVQFSQRAGEGFIIRAGNTAALAEFGRLLRKLKLEIVYHNALHDLAVLRAMGIETSDLPFGDTMVMSYLLQLEPQGLKPLCVRHAGMRMQSYDEIIGDAGNLLAINFLDKLLTYEEDTWDARRKVELHRLQTTPYMRKDGKVMPGRKVKTLPKLPKSRLHRAVERCLRSKRPRGLWDDQDIDIHVQAYDIQGIMPEASLDDVPLEKAIHYGCRDSDGTCRVEPHLLERRDNRGLKDTYKLEMSTYPLIDRMQQIGMKPDIAHFSRLSGKLGNEIQSLQVELARVTGNPDFNANSGNQVADLLYDQYKLPGSKRTSSGRYSTNDKILEGLEHEFGLDYPAISTIREYREVYKLKNTFVDRIPDFVERFPFDGRVHSTFRTTRVVTGRLAASDPNILAQPEHGKFAKDFKKGWIADEGHVLCSWDQSQIELRILAHLSQDPYMLAVFRGEVRNPDGSLIDLHAALAQRIFGVPPHLQDKSKHRLPAKAINFGIPMGMQAQGLLVQLRKEGLLVSLDDAQRWLDETLDTYKGVAQYQKDMIASARQHGYIRCMSGRIRYIGGIKSWDERIRAEAERFSFSTPIQEGAQYVMKTCEARIWKYIKGCQRGGVYIEPLAQIHDALKMEVQRNVKDTVNLFISGYMTKTFKGLSVPLAVEGEWGMNFAPKWLDKKKGIIYDDNGMRGFDE